MSELEPFGPKSAWLAVRDRTQADVLEALGLTGGRQVEPQEAVGAFMDTGVLPPLPGVGGRWTLVISFELADISTRRLTSLSALLGTQVQAFSTHRVVEAHRWALADRGRLVRHVQVLRDHGELQAWEGEPTSVEVDHGLPATAVVAESDAADVVLAVTEDLVLAVAGAWSIHPMTLRGRSPGPALLVEDVDEGPPPPQPLPPTTRRRWWWSPPGRR